MSIESVIPSNHLILCCPLLLPSIFPSIRVFSNESALRVRWPKYQSFSNSPSSEYSGLISFRIDWFDLLAVQGFKYKYVFRQHLPQVTVIFLFSDPVYNWLCLISCFLDICDFIHFPPWEEKQWHLVIFLLNCKYAYGACYFIFKLFLIVLRMYISIFVVSMVVN